MSGFFAPKTTAPSSSPVSSLRLQTSTRGRVIPIAYGLTRVAGNLIWFGDFKSNSHEQTTGGKGGGGGGNTTVTYTYSAAVIMAICEGAINAIPRVWRQKEVFIGSVEPTRVQRVLDEAHYVESLTVTVANAADYVANVKVEAAEDYGRITLPEGPAGYTVLGGGVYSFNAAWAGYNIFITYTYNAVNQIADAAAQAGLATTSGDYDQIPPGWMTTKHPTEALSYRGTCYVSSSAYSLGGSPDLANHSFEVNTQWGYSSTIRDANPKDVIMDLLTNPKYGMGFPAAKIGDMSTYSTFCVANGLFVSPAYTDPAPTKDLLTALMTITNSGIVFSEGLLKVLPYGDVAVTGNGVTYTPNTTPIYDLTDDQFLHEPGEDPIRVTRKPQADAYNHVRGKFYNRASDYNEEIAEAKDQPSIEMYGLRSMPVLEMKEVCDSASARNIVQLVLQRQLHIRNSYEFRLGWGFALLEPMDLVTLTDSALGMDRTPVRITSIEETDDGDLLVVAEEFPANVLNAALYNIQPAGGYATNYNVSPGTVLTPVVFEAPVSLADNKDGLEVWIAAGGTNSNYGGCQIWISTDDATYMQVGNMFGSSRYGQTTSSLGSQPFPGVYADTVGIELVAGGQILSGTTDDMELLNTLCYIDGEYLSYETSTLLAPNEYSLTPLNRGVFYSEQDAHASGSPFVRCDTAIARIPLNTLDYVGKTLYVKLLAFNIYGGAIQQLADVAASTYSVTGRFVNMPPGAITGLGLEGSFDIGTAKIKWNAVPSAVSYDVQVWAGSPTPTMRRTLRVGDTLHYEYTALDATADGGPWRSVDFKVAPVSATDVLGAYTTLNVSNPQIAALSSPGVTVGPMQFSFKCTRPTEPDYAGVQVWMSTTNGFTPDASSLAYDGASPAVTLTTLPNGSALVNGTTYYFRAAGYDTLGKDSLNMSSQMSAVAAEALTTKYATAFLYQWNASTPGDPSGTSTYTWATGASSAYSGGNGWSTSIPANPGTPGLKLWVTSKQVSDPSTATTSTISWASGFTAAAWAQNGSTGPTGSTGAAGANGLQSATPTVYQWAISIPAGPSGSATYTWATGAFGAAPSGWSLTPGTSPSPGYTLWAARVSLIDSAAVSSTGFNWTSASIAATGAAGATGPTGSTGSTGTTGSSYRAGYSRVTGSTLATSPATVTTSGSSSFPTTGTWGETVAWTATVPSISAGESLFQIDGIYSPTTGNTVWTAPYLSSLKVGTLSAITANLGTITSGDITGTTFRTTASGQRVTINESNNNKLIAYDSGGSAVAEIGGSLGIVWATSSSGITPTILGYSTVGTLSTIIPAVFGSGVGHVGVWGASTDSYGVHGSSTNHYGVRAASTNSNGLFANSATIEAIYASNTSGTASGHGIRGQAKFFGSSSVSSGVVAATNGYDFYADGAGTNYGPFTGAHDVVWPVDVIIEPGDIVIDVECVIRSGWSNTLFKVAKSTESGQAGAVGVLSLIIGPLSNSIPAVFGNNIESVVVDPELGDVVNYRVINPIYDTVKNLYILGAANAVGEGQMNVVNEGGNIAVGDLIICSSTAGKGMRQPDGIVRSNTVARARESITFGGPDEVKLVACIYLCG